MISSPSIPFGPVGHSRREAMRLVVLFGPEDGTAPELEHEAPWLLVDRVSIGSSGQRDDVIILHADLATANMRLLDTTTPKGFNRQIEVRILDEENQPTQILCWGFLARQPQVINDQTESVGFEARLDASAYGLPLRTIPLYDPENGMTESHRPAGIGSRREAFVFNPEIDDKIEPNRSNKQRINGDHADDTDEEYVPWYYPIDPESMRTTRAEGFQEQARSLWKLGEAIIFLCNWLNPDETYITNPHETEDLGLDLADTIDTDLIKNVAIPFGATLPQALDALLLPIGFSWYRQYTLKTEEVDDEEVTTRVTKLRFFRRGIGLDVHFRLQRPGEVISNRKTNLREFSAVYSIVDLANTVTVYGNYIGIEATWELIPTWEIADDEIGLEELEKDQPTAIEKPLVGRKFVLDTAGDYLEQRAWHDEAYNMADLFGEPMAYRRRHFEKCLSLHSTAEDQESNRVRLDWFDWDNPDAEDPEDAEDSGWTKVVWPFSLLEKEAGILFTGAKPPGELWAYYYNAVAWAATTVYEVGALVRKNQNIYRCTDNGTSGSSGPEGTGSGISDGTVTWAQAVWLRVTAVLRSDKRIVGEATRRDESPNGLNLHLRLDLPDKFEKTSVHSSSVFDGLPSLARDDTTAIQTYAERIQEIEDCAEISCAVTLEGADHPEYKIGQSVLSVSGRNLALNGYALESGDARYPQILGFNYVFEGQQVTEVLLESFKQERPEV